jgi:hypothetical protein
MRQAAKIKSRLPPFPVRWSAETATFEPAELRPGSDSPLVQLALLMGFRGQVILSIGCIQHSDRPPFVCICGAAVTQLDCFPLIAGWRALAQARRHKGQHGLDGKIKGN